MATVIRRYRKWTVNDDLLHTLVAPTVSVVADYGNVIDIEFDDSVPGLSETLDEYMAEIDNPGLSAAKPAFAYDSDQDIYVNASTGNDANSGTITAPFKTIDRAMLAAAASWTDFCRLHFAAGDYSVTGQIGTTGIRNDFIGKPVGGNARPVSWIGEFGDVSGTLTAVAGSSATQAVVAGPLTPDDFLGATVLVLTGAATGTRMQIRGNDATTILFMAGTANPIGVGDTFRVERPATVFKLDADVNYWQIFGCMGGTAGLNVKGIKFDLMGNGMNISGIGMGCAGVEFANGGGFIYLEHTILHTQPVFTDPDFQTFDEYNAGIYFNAGGPSAAYNLGLFESSHVYDTCVFKDCSVDIVALGELNLVSMELVGSYIYTDGPGNFRHVDSAVRGRVRDVTPGSGMTAAINIVAGTGQNIWGIDFGNITGNAIAIRGAGNAPSLQDLGNIPATTVTGFGIMCDQMSRAHRLGGVVVTGTAGDTQVGGTTKAYGALPFYNANLSAIE